MGRKDPQQNTAGNHRRLPEERLGVLVCGDRGTGKSTLVNRLHALTGYRPDEERCGAECRHAPGEPSGEASDGAAFQFLAAGKRCCAVTDAAADERHLPDLLGAATGCDVAIIVVDATHGLSEESARLVFLATFFGIRRIALVVNKMDRADFRQDVYEAIGHACRKLLTRHEGLEIVTIPVSASTGDNLATPSSNMPWHRESTLIGYLEAVSVPVRPASERLVFPVQDSVEIDGCPRGLSGHIVEGTARPGDEIRVTGSGSKARIARIVTMGGDLTQAGPGTPVVLELDADIDAGRGDVLSSARLPVESTDQFEAGVVWIGKNAGLTGRTYEIRLAHQEAPVTLTSIKYRINPLTSAHEACRQLEKGEVAVCNVAVSRPLPFDAYEQCRFLGSFILLDREQGEVVAVGMIRHSLRRAQNIHRQALSIKREDRESLNGHPGKVIWFTGLSGSGKSTLANALEVELHRRGMRTYILDGDNVRHGLNKDLGFTDADRVENIRRIAEVARLMADAGLIVMTAFISPFRREREMARELVGNASFLEVHVSTPLRVCEARDPKGLYRQARAGAIPNMTGINSPYEAPEAPDYEARCGEQPIEAIVDELVAKIVA